MTAAVAAAREKKSLFLWTGVVALWGIGVFALIAYVAGQDGNWDFYNYHYYNPYAFLNDRFWFDIMPAQRQTNIAPFLDIPFYWLTQVYGIVAASLVYAGVQAWQAPAIFASTFLLLDSRGASHRASIATALVLTPLAALSPLNLQLAGTTTGDSTTAVLVLWALCLFLLAQSRFVPQAGGRLRTSLFFLTGLLLGAAVGFKLTNGPFAVALALCAFTLKDEPGIRLRVFLLICLAGTLGFLLTYGYWGWFLYSEFQNPLFPTFNQVFKSEFMKPVQLNDETFKAETLVGVIFYPFLYNAYTGAIKYQQFFDLRIPVVYALVVVSGVSLLFSRSARSRLAESPMTAGLLLFVLVSYLIWIYLFSISRYLLVLEVMTPLVAVTVAGLVFGRKWPAVAITLLALLPVAFSTWEHTQRNNAFGYRTPWAETVFEIDFPDIDISGSMVLVTGGQAMAFLIPYGPQDTRFVRIDSNINYVGYTSIAERYDNLLGERLRQAIDGHDGDFFVIYTDGEEPYVGPDLAYFGIGWNRDSCQPIRSKGPNLTICRAYRRP
jgi:hypothetical protein